MVLPDVCRDQLVGRCIETESEHVAKAVGVNLCHSICGLERRDERIGNRHAIFSVRARLVDARCSQSRVEWIDPQNLAQHIGQVLTVTRRGIMSRTDVIRRPTVA